MPFWLILVYGCRRTDDEFVGFCLFSRSSSVGHCRLGLLIIIYSCVRLLMCLNYLADCVDVALQRSIVLCWHTFCYRKVKGLRNAFPMQYFLYVMFCLVFLLQYKRDIIFIYINKVFQITTWFPAKLKKK